MKPGLWITGVMVLCLLLAVPSTVAVAYTHYDTFTVAGTPGTESAILQASMTFHATQNVTLTNFSMPSTSDASDFILYLGHARPPQGTSCPVFNNGSQTMLFNGTITDDNGAVDYNITAGLNYTICADNRAGGTHTLTYTGAGNTFPKAGNTSVFTYTRFCYSKNDSAGGCNDAGYLRDFTGIYFSNASIVPPNGTNNNLTIQVNDTRTGSAISGFTYNLSNGSVTWTGYCAGTTCTNLTNVTGATLTVTNVSGGLYFNPPTVTGITFNTSGTATTYSAQAYNTNLTLNLSNVVNGSGIPSFCANVSNSTSSQANCTTNTNLIFAGVSGTLNISWYNISGGSYYNVSKTVSSFNATNANYTNTTYQALIIVSAYRLFLNTSINTFNVTNNLIKNTTTTGNLTIYANNGSNTLVIDVPGNYSITTSVNATQQTTAYANVTGVYDNRYIFGANYNGGNILTFAIGGVNATLGVVNGSTTNGSVVLALLQGYSYYFTANSASYSLANASLNVNASTHLYNFSLLTINTFELHFYNESTDSPILSPQNVTVQVISTLSAGNYTTNNGTLIASLLTPGDYTLRYWVDVNIPRDYYVTLTNQSYQNLTLYIVDSAISQAYLPVIVDESTNPLSLVTIRLLRYYVTGNTYKVVEMETTDSNGQAVFRVVPNVINYKLLLTKDNVTSTTAPTKFTSDTNTYTLQLTENPLISYFANPGIARSLTFNNATSTYTFTWTDAGNIVTQGCMLVTKYQVGLPSVVGDTCTSGATGSIIYTVTDYNQTKYTASAYLDTSTRFSSLPGDTLTVSYVTDVATFGLVGLIIAILLVGTLGIFGAEYGSKGLVVTSVIGLIIVGAFGIVVQAWEAVIGVVILGAVAIFRMR